MIRSLSLQGDPKLYSRIAVDADELLSLIHIYVVYNDMSLSEIAEENGISRQGVHDLIKRCDKTLSAYEDKLHLISKFQTTRRMVEEIHKKTRVFKETKDESLIDEIEQISNDIMEL